MLMLREDAKKMMETEFLTNDRVKNSSYKAQHLIKALH